MSVWARRAAVIVVLLAAGLAAVMAYPHLQDLTARADTGWWSVLEVVAIDGLLVGSGLVLLVAEARSWSAWLTVALSIPVHIAVTVAATNPWVAWLVGLWPAVVVALGCVTFVRNRNAGRADARQEEGR